MTKHKMNRRDRRRQQAMHRQNQSAGQGASPPKAQKPMPSHIGPEDDFSLLNAVDGFAPLRNGLRKIADARSDWAGIPMPLESIEIVIHPKFPNADGLMSAGKVSDTSLEEGVVAINAFYSNRLNAEVYIWKEPDGRILWNALPSRLRTFKFAINTLDASVAWGIEQEHKALMLLADLLPHHAFKKYLLTGSFIETSKRSGVVYMFRKLRPTVAISTRGHNGNSHILACLCMHPIAYYKESWAGGMCPTDDVVSHLLLMRGDEHEFWKRSTQHSPFRPEAGL